MSGEIEVAFLYAYLQLLFQRPAWISIDIGDKHVTDGATDFAHPAL